MTRCFGDGDPLYERYHDTEWGFPAPDERALFELLSLEAFQAGLSWRTILGKREAFRSAFANFDAEAVARFGPADVKRLMDDAGIVRNRAKIEATDWERARCPAAARSRPDASLTPPAGAASTATPAPADVERGTSDDARGRSPCARAQGPRLSLPWPYDALRIDPGVRRRRRPPRSLPDTSGRRTRAPCRRPDLMPRPTS